MTPTELARTAQAWYADGPWVGRTIQSLRPYICPFHRLLDYIPTGARVLDIGCGSGLLLVLAALTRGLGPSIGFDANGRAIALAGRAADRLAAAGEAAPEFRQLDVRAEWPNGAFPVVALIDVLHHVPPAARRAVVEQAAAKVAPGGRFLYKDIGRRPRWRAFMNRLHDLVMAREWIHYADLDAVIGWTTAQGLTIIHRERINQWWYPHDLVVFERPAA